MDYEDTLHELAQQGGELYHPSGRIKKNKNVTRAEVISAFQTSFEMIGGVPRLAVWADQNPSDFFKLYGRLLPASSTTELDGPQEILVRMALAPKQLGHQQTPDGSTNNRTQVPAPRDLSQLP